MTVVSSHRDTDALTLTFVAEFAAPPERVWQVWQDPALLSRWWGPPTWPATFTSLELAPGGTAAYFMTGPDGTRAHGAWRVTTVEPPHRLELIDAFADESGAMLDDPPPFPCVVTLEAAGPGTRMTIVTTFDSAESLEKVAEMGMEQGMREALGQIDALLAEPASL